MAAHRLIQRRQEVLVELLLRFLVQLVVLLQKRFLGAQHLESVLPRGRSYPLAFVPATVCRCESFDLFNDGLSGVDLINDREKGRQFCLVTRQGFQLVYKVISALGREQGQFVNVRAVAFLSQLERVLLQIEGPEQLVDR